MKLVLEKLKIDLQEKLDSEEIIVDDVTFEEKGKYHFLTVTLDKIGGIDLETIVDATKIVNEVVDKADITDDSYILDVVSKEESKMNGKELIKALNNLVEEKNISADVIFEALELALQTAYKKNFNSKTNVRVNINRETGDIKVYSYYVVVPEIDEGSVVEDEEGNVTKIEPEINRDAQILLEDAIKIVPTIKIGETIEEEVTPKDFGRVAAGTAKEAEKNSVIEEFSDKQDELMVGMVAMEDQNNYYIDLGRTRGILPKKEIIPGEQIVMGSSIKVYVSKVESGPKGPIIKLSLKDYLNMKYLKLQMVQ